MFIPDLIRRCGDQGTDKNKRLQSSLKVPSRLLHSRKLRSRSMLGPRCQSWYKLDFCRVGYALVMKGSNIGIRKVATPIFPDVEAKARTTTNTLFCIMLIELSHLDGIHIIYMRSCCV